MASQSMFDNVIGNYSVRYQLASGSNDLTTVYTSSTNVTLEDLVPNAEYNVSVVGINSCGGTSSPVMTHLDLQGIYFLHVQLLSASLQHPWSTWPYNVIHRACLL